MQLRQKAGAGFGSASSAYCGVEAAMIRRNRDKVASQNDHIRMQVIDDSYGRSQGRGRQVVIVKIAKLRDRETIKCVRQACNRNIKSRQFRMIRLQDRAVFRDRKRSRACGYRAALKESPPRKRGQ